MKQYERFAVCLRKLLKQKNVSVTELSRMMGFKSRNSLFRIVNDQTSSDTEAAFLASLREKGVLPLSDAEWGDLEVALEISRYGRNEFIARKAISHLMMETHAPPDDAGDEPHPLDAIIGEFADCTEVRMMICNCCRLSFMQALRNSLVTFPNTVKLFIEHYIHSSQEMVVQNIAATRPLLFFDWYKPYIVPPHACSPERDAMLRTSCFTIIGTDAQGRRLQRQFFMLAEFELRELRLEMGFELLLVKMLDGMRDCITPMKDRTHCPDDLPQTYLAYTEEYRQLERNRAVYSIKPDIPINYIHPDLLRQPLIDGFAQLGMAPNDESEALIGQFYDIHLKRWENFATKTKVTHTVFTRKAMERFARTGRQSDHFFGMRPYTPDERRSILTALREMAVSNPYFNVHFLKDSTGVDPGEITLYDGRGVLLTCPGTDYDLGGDHTEVLITNESFADKFRDFYLHELLTGHVMGYHETLAVLDELIRMIE